MIVKTRAGHSDSKMTERYIDLASVLKRAGYGEVFPPLPQALLRAAATSDEVRSVPLPASSERVAEPADDLDDDDFQIAGSEPRVAAARVLH